MYIYFDENGKELGTSTASGMSMGEANKIEVGDYDQSKTYSYVNGELVVTDKQELVAEISDYDKALMVAQNNRRESYPSVAEQLDYIYHNGVDAWKTDIIDPIKAKYPKP